MAYTINRTTQSGVDILVMVPDSYNPAVPTPLMYYHHGASGDREAVLTPYLINVVERLLSDGYIVAGISAGSWNWGNDDALDKYVDAHTYLIGAYNINKTILIGQSMGGISSLITIANSAIPNIAGWVGIYPVCDLQNQYGVTFYGDQINAAYGVSSYGAIPAGHNPITRTASLYATIPMRIYASPADNAVNKAANSDAFASYVANITPEHAVVLCSGDHGDSSHFQQADVSAFVARALANNYNPTPSGASISTPNHVWKFTEASGNAADSIGSKTLTNNNGVTYSAGTADFGTTWNSNKVFSGANGSLGINQTSAAWTVSIPVKLHSEPSNNNTFLMDWRDSKEFIVKYRDASGTKKVTIDAAGNTIEATVTAFGTSAFHQITVTHTSGGAISVYLDGNTTPIATGNMGANSGNNTFGIGGYGGASNSSAVILKPVMTWDKVLTTDEIAALWDSGNIAAYPFSQIPSASISAASTLISTGTATTVSWSSTNATSVQVNKAGSSFSTSASGTAVSTGNLSSNTIFDITAIGAGGSATASVTINVSSAHNFDGGLGISFVRQLTGNETFTQSNMTPFKPYFFAIQQGTGTTYNPTWFDGITWLTGSAPAVTTTSNGYTYYQIWCTGVNTFFGFKMF